MDDMNNNQNQQNPIYQVPQPQQPMNYVKICSKCNTINSVEDTVCRICGCPLTDVTPVAQNSQPQYAQPPVQQYSQPQYTQPPVQQYSQPQYTQPPVQQYGQPQNTQPPVQQYSQPQYTQPPVQQYGQPQYTQPKLQYNMDSTLEDDVTVKDLSTFVGAKSTTYIPKFISKSQGRKVGFNGAVFVFGILFSPIITSFWFFHRKMKKAGALILALGVLLLAVSLPLTASYMTDYLSVTKLAVVASQNYAEENDEEISSTIISSFILSGNMEKYLTEEQTAEYEQATTHMMSTQAIMMLLNALQLGLAVVLALFADYIYYRFAVGKIKAIKTAKPDYTDDDIRYAGGTRSALWAVLLVVYIILVVVFSIYMSYSVVTPFINDLTDAISSSFITLIH